jgi:hypothetical protein
MEKSNLNTRLKNISKSDLIISALAMVAGVLISFFPFMGPPAEPAGRHDSFHAYERFMQRFLEWPWNLVALCLLFFLLVSAKFRRGGSGVAGGMEIIIGRMFTHILR